MSLLELFCHVDDFWQAFAPTWYQTLLQTGQIKRRRAGQLTMSEIMTILIHFHQSHYRDFKAFYTQYVLLHLREDFPDLVSYHRFVELIPSVLVPLCVYLDARRGRCSGISFVDSTPWRSVPIPASSSTASSQDWPSVARTRWAGFTGSNST
jgi:hypothetical protein